MLVCGVYKCIGVLIKMLSIRYLKTFVKVIGKINKSMGFGLGFLVFPMTFILIYAAVMRYVFNSPPIWTLELNQFLMGGYFLLAGGYAILREAHVRMDCLYERFSLKKKLIFDIATVPLPFIYLGLVMQASASNAWQSFLLNQLSRTVWAPPVWPVKTCIVIGCVLLILQVIAYLIRDIYLLKGVEMEVE